MANYYTEACFILPLSKTQKTFALSVIECATDQAIDFTDKSKVEQAKQYDTDVFTLAKQLVTAFDYTPGEVCLEFVAHKDEDGIQISHDEHINTEAAAMFCHLMLKHFNLNEHVVIEAAHTCSATRVNGYGGHAAFITKVGIKWFSTHEWISQQIAQK